MNINFQALGCRLNEAELETWASQFMQQGHQVTTDSSEADVLVFNSCAVTAEADRKSRQQIGRLHRKNPDAKLVVTGCHASLNSEKVKDYLGVDLVVGNQQKDQLVEQTLMLAGDPGELVNPVSTGTENSLLLRGRHRGFIKVQDGCRYRCSYCIVTIARGEERSRSKADILDEINRLYAGGIREIAITGVHVGGYGSDNGSSLYELLNDILHGSEMPRIRLASVEPWDLGDEFFSLFENPRLLPHMHLPIQSGTDSVLRRMSRRCKTAEFERLVDMARSAIPLFNVTTDLIAGFPGETDQEWRETMAFIERVGFGHMHIFTFSPREGTKAASMSDQIPNVIKKGRSAEMHELAAELKRRELARHIGSNAEVLWEQQINSETGQWVGYTPHYHKITSNNASIEESSILETSIDSVSVDGLMLVNQSKVSGVSVPFTMNAGPTSE